MMQILIACDNTEQSTKAAEWALRNFTTGEFSFVHAYPYPMVSNVYGIAHPPMVVPPNVNIADLKKNSEAIVSKHAALFEGHEDRVKHKYTVMGDPRDVILDVVKKGNYDVMVTGARELSGAGRFFLGSVSDYSLHYAPCSVAIYKDPSAITKQPPPTTGAEANPSIVEPGYAHALDDWTEVLETLPREPPSASESSSAESSVPSSSGEASLEGTPPVSGEVTPVSSGETTPMREGEAEGAQRRVMIALDRSDADVKTLEFAKKFVRANDKLLFAHAYTPFEKQGTFFKTFTNEVAQGLNKDYKEDMTKYMTESAKDLEQISKTKCEMVVLPGDPRNIICDLVEACHIDTFIMGSRGRGEVKSVLLGSVSRHCAHHAKATTIVIK